MENNVHVWLYKSLIYEFVKENEELFILKRSCVVCKFYDYCVSKLLYDREMKRCLTPSNHIKCNHHFIETTNGKHVHKTRYLFSTMKAIKTNYI